MTHRSAVIDHRVVWTGSHELAIQMMRDLYGFDMSKHGPRQVNVLPLDRFDLIVAIDPAADAWLRSRSARAGSPKRPLLFRTLPRLTR